MKKYDEVRDKMLKNSKVKKEYDKLEKEYTEEQNKIVKSDTESAFKHIVRDKSDV